MRLNSSSDAASAAGAGDANQSVIDGSVITFHDIHYSVQVPDPDKFCGKITKDILKGVSGVFKPGMNAILGVTGSGKSMLLDILVGRKDPAGLSGHVLVDGHSQPKNFKCMSGYVVQNDIVLGTQTVRENLTFSANLRLPESISPSEKKRRVEEAISELGLEDCADTKVGTEFIRGISGGERKRTNIGMELIISPSVLFLDEPTTGLDAYTALAIIQLLHSLSRRGRTVIFSIHQPRYAIYRLFDRLLMLGQGKTIFHGPAGEALDFFSTMGYTCEKLNNPADFFLDVMQGDHEPIDEEETDIDEEGTGAATDLANRWVSRSLEYRKVLCDRIVDQYCISKWHRDLREEIDPVLKEYQQNKVACRKEPTYATSIPTQLRFLAKRFLINLLRTPQVSTIQVLVTMVIAMSIGFIYYDVDRTYPNGIQNRSGAFYTICLNIAFANMNALNVFIGQRAIFRHENVSGFYRVSTYFIAKIASDILPMRASAFIPYAFITHFMIGFEADIDKFLFYLLHVVLLAVTSTCIVLLISSYCDVFSTSFMVMILVFSFMMIFGGVLFNVKDITPVLRWMQYFSIFRYSMKALCINEMKDLVLCDRKNGTCSNFANIYLQEQGIAYETAWDLWQNEIGLFLIMVFSLVATYVQLRKLPKLK